ncbi:right-handed parallel beta-helix repeat-containing protein [uncultured Methanobrevibacter sp.]|uniref:right-handed parallel beta-helix repeat-containing protein n=1 Tax=uncultured Methanobrevibacter sp. TaxID=253161 RepID=UPI00260F84D3|nr:right-handed parallel beta-helix repeat-containing protein [uncultured Methanobrevibacter sp.]
MVKNIKFSLILLLLIFVSLSAVNAAEDVNATVDDNIITDGMISYEPISYDRFSDSDIITQSMSHKVSSSNYDTYFDDEGYLKGSSVQNGDTLNLDGTFNDKKFILNKELNIVGTSSNKMYDCSVVLLKEASGSSVSHLNIENNGYDLQGIFLNEVTKCNIFNNKINNTGPSCFPIAVNPGSTYNNITNNILASYGATYGHGTRSTSLIVLGGAHHNYIANNYLVTEDANAIYLSSYGGGSFVGAISNYNVIFNNTIKANIIPTSWNYAIQLMGNYNTADSNTIIGTFRSVSSTGVGTTVINNKIINATGKDHNTNKTVGGDYAIVVSNYSVVSNNIIQNALLNGAGICVGEYSNVTDNVIDVHGKAYGVQAEGNYVLIKNNDIKTNNSAGIYQMGQYDYLTVTNNNIVSNTGVGILLKKQSSTKFPANVVITDNNITTSNQYAVDAAEADKSTYTIKNNNCHGSKILTPEGVVDPSKPAYVFNGTVYTVTVDNYNNFFDENGNLNSNIKMRDTLNFVGTFNDKIMLITEGIKIVGKNAVFNNSMFKVTASHVWIENITINNKKSSSTNRWGINVVDTNQVMILNNNISVIDPNAAYAIYMYRSGNVEVVNNTLYSHGDYLTYTLLGYGAENCVISGNVINTLGTGILHLYESSKCIDGKNDVKEIFRTYGILMLYSSDNEVLNNNVTVKSLVNQSRATVNGNFSTNSLVGIDFYFDSSNNIISGNNILVEGKDNYVYGMGVIGAETGSGSSKHSSNNKFLDNDVKVIGSYFATGIIIGYNSANTLIHNNDVEISADNLIYGITLEMSQYSNVVNNRINSKAEVIYGIEAYSSNNNKISGNIISGTGKMVYGFAGYASCNNIISNNKITSNGNGKSISFKNFDSIKEGNAGIRFVAISTGNVIDNNEIVSNIGYAVDFDAKAINNTVTNNYLVGKAGSGNDGVNNSKNNIVSNNYRYTFEDIVFGDVTVSYLDAATIKITAKLPYTGGVAAKATFYINGVKIGDAVFNNGVATLKYQLNASYVPGYYSVTAILSKTNYKSVNATANLIVTKGKLNIKFDEVVGKAGSSVYFTAIVKNSLGEAVKGITVEFYRSGIYAGKAVTDENGVAKLIFKIPTSFKGSYALSANATGNNCYLDSSIASKLTIGDMVYTVISIKDIIMYYRDGTRLEGTLKDLDGHAIAGATVSITINGIKYSRVTDANGKFSMAINLNAGNYSVYVKFDSNNKQSGSEANSNVLIKSTIASRDIIKMFRNDTQYFAVFRDSNGNLLKNQDVRFNINGVWYTRTTNAVGTARLNINLNPGTFIITAVNSVNGEQVGNNITVLSLFKENNDLVKYFKNDSQYKVKVIKQDGSVAGAGEEVTFNINGVFYKRTTDANGYATLKINLNPGNYIITAMYKDCMVSNKITVKPILFASDLSMKYHDGSKFKATLLDGQGKPYANQNVTFNINGVFYNRLTDSNGIASLNINLIPGKYIITSTFNGAAISNTITIA